MSTWRRGCESFYCIEVDMEPAWIKSCDSAACIEVDMQPAWVRGCDAGACVEVSKGTTVKIRDSKDPDGPVLTFSYEEWKNFTEGIIGGKFD